MLDVEYLADTFIQSDSPCVHSCVTQEQSMCLLIRIRRLAHGSLWTLGFELQNVLGLGFKHPPNLLQSPPGWLRGSVRLSDHRGHQVQLGGPWDCELRGPGLHQGQEALCLHPGLGLQRLDRGKHQEVHLWESLETISVLRKWFGLGFLLLMPERYVPPSLNGRVIQSEWVTSFTFMMHMWVAPLGLDWGVAFKMKYTFGCFFLLVAG